jgi:hypothetical protein
MNEEIRKLCIAIDNILLQTVKKTSSYMSENNSDSKKDVKKNILAILDEAKNEIKAR